MPGGHPRSFKSVEELQEGIDEYIAQDEALNIAGLAAFLGVNKDTINEYGKGTYDDEDEKYSVPIKKVVQMIEGQTVSKMLLGKYNPTGCIFVLKNNFGWRDQREVKGEHTIKAGVYEMSDDELASIASGGS